MATPHVRKTIDVGVDLANDLHAAAAALGQSDSRFITNCIIHYLNFARTGQPSKISPAVDPAGGIEY